MISQLLGNRLPVLAYHRIASDSQDPLAVSPMQFAAQIRWLYENGWKAIGMSDVLTLLKGRLSLRNVVALTFDDGFADVLSVAYPILSHYGFTATIFIVTGKLGQISDWHRIARPAPLIDHQGLDQLHAAGFTLGSHTVSHPRLSLLNDVELRRELTDSYAFLSQRFGLDRVFFAYPFGAWGERERCFVAEAGYEGACTLGGFWGNGYESDHLALNRFEIRGHYSLREFTTIVSALIKWPLIRKPWERIL